MKTYRKSGHHVSCNTVVENKVQKANTHKILKVALPTIVPIPTLFWATNTPKNNDCKKEISNYYETFSNKCHTYVAGITDFQGKLVTGPRSGLNQNVCLTKNFVHNIMLDPGPALNPVSRPNLLDIPNQFSCECVCEFMCELIKLL